jgi:hypothetical protein
LTYSPSSAAALRPLARRFQPRAMAERQSVHRSPRSLRHAQGAHRPDSLIRQHSPYGKLIAIMVFGCCTYQVAGDAGGIVISPTSTLCRGDSIRTWTGSQRSRFERLRISMRGRKAHVAPRLYRKIVCAPTPPHSSNSRALMSARSPWMVILREASVTPRRRARGMSPSR